MAAQQGDILLVGAYFPLGQQKTFFFESFLGPIGRLADSRSILLGDFNTGRHFEDEAGATFWAPEYMDKLKEGGFTDAWRHLHPREREYTWFSPQGNGFRLDYVFLARPLLPALSAARHVQTVRDGGVSDHAALMVELS